MAIQVLMPQLGESVEEATVTKWLKTEGDPVEEYEALVEVNTDKVDTEVPAPASGTLLKIVCLEEETPVKVGMVLAWIGEPGEEIPAGDSAPNAETQIKIQRTEEQPMEATTPKTSHIASAPKDSDKVLGFISPIVAKIAAEREVNLRQVQGTGLNGRITKRDILAYVEGSRVSDTPVSDAPTPIAPVRPQKPQLTPDTITPHSNIRRRIAEHMVMSKHTSPHVTTVFEADMGKVVAHRTSNKKTFSQDGTNLTFTAYFVAATAVALKAFPIVNSSWSAEGIILHRDVNIGMATSLGDEGLIVPVIKQADELSLRGIARVVNDLASRARSKQLNPDEVSNGTFTITNHGISGSLFAMPIINQPQSAILGVGKLQKRVVVLADEAGYDTIGVRPMVYLTLTFDHRILDGAVADYFLAKVVNTLENWS